MPWFPDFVAAAELARQETRVDDQADPVAAVFLCTGQGRRRCPSSDVAG